MHSLGTPNGLVQIVNGMTLAKSQNCIKHGIGCMQISGKPRRALVCRLHAGLKEVLISVLFSHGLKGEGGHMCICTQSPYIK